MLCLQTPIVWRETDSGLFGRGRFVPGRSREPRNRVSIFIPHWSSIVTLFQCLYLIIKSTFSQYIHIYTEPQYCKYSRLWTIPIDCLLVSFYSFISRCCCCSIYTNKLRCACASVVTFSAGRLVLDVAKRLPTHNSPPEYGVPWRCFKSRIVRLWQSERICKYG